MMTERHGQPTRLAELMACLSLATDLGMGQPLEQAVNTCLLSVRAGRALGLPERDLSDIYYLSLLRFVGCTADAHEAAARVGGDEISSRAELATVLMADQLEFLLHLLRNHAADQPGLKRLGLLAGAVLEGSRSAERSIAEHCEVAQMLVTRIGIRPEVGIYVGQLFERWDGKGLPGEMAGESIPAPCRVVPLARDVEIFQRLGGWPLVTDVLRRRRGRAYDPSLADLFLDLGQEWLAEIEGGLAWETVLAAEPDPILQLSEMKLDDVLRAFADFIDLKSPFTRGHSTAVAELAGTAADTMGLGESQARDARRAGLVHDLGRAGIPNGIWDKRAPLSPAEWERVRLHPYLTERILSHSAALKELASLAGAHHERLDGSGYHRGSAAAAIPATAKILAAADAYQAMTQARPHRPALEPSARESELRDEVSAGRLDAGAVNCVLVAAGHSAAPARRSWPAGLTDREVEVLQLISRGHSNHDVARLLTISAKTVGRHVENIYGKIGVSSRPAAAHFAMEHRLLHS